MGEDFVDQKVCDERFNRIIAGQEKIERKVDVISGAVAEIRITLAESTVQKKQQEARIKRLEMKKEKEAEDAIVEVKNLPAKQRLDRRYIIGLAIPTIMSLIGLGVSLFK